MRRRLFFFLFPCALASAKVSPFVPGWSPVYDAIEQLEAYGCAYSTSRLLRPQVYEDLRNAVYVADAEDLCKAPEWLLRERATLWNPFLPNEGAAEVFLQQHDALALNGIEAAVSPLYPLREGRPAVNGANLNLELRFAAGAGRDDAVGIALGATPGLLLGVEDYQSAKAKAYFQEGFVKVGYRWAELALGRIGYRFGDARHGNLLLSGADKPLDSIALTIRPHVFGTPFGFLGPFSFRWVVGNLGTSAFVDKARFSALFLSLRPAVWLELAWMEIFQFGGTGVAPLTSGEALSMFLYSGNSTLDAKRTRSMGFQIALREPKTKGKLYAQAYQEGYSGEWSWLAGLWFPRLAEGVELRLEGVATARDAYTHPTYRQGLTHEGLPLGHPLGPDAAGAYFDLGFSVLRSWKLELGAFWESRDRHPAAGSAAEDRIGGGLGLSRMWQNTRLRISGRGAAATGAQYLPGEKNTLVSILGELSYAFF